MAGLVTLRALDDEMARLSERLPELGDDPLTAMSGTVELLLAEYTSGDIDRDEFLESLRAIAPLRFEEVASPSYSVRTITTARPHLLRWMGTVPLVLSPAAGTAREAVPA